MNKQKLFTVLLMVSLVGGVLVPTDSASAQGAWRAEYYANCNLAGAPTVMRYDAALDFDWKDGSPDPAIPADGFSARWVRTLYFSAGAYRFFSSSDEGARIDVEGARVLEAWDGPHATRWGDVVLTEGQHTILVEYYEGSANARVHVWWDRLGSFGGWAGRYYDNAGMRGGPFFIRDDAEINFDWGEGAPVNGMPSDNFSAVWTRQINFAPAHYRFNVRADDGVRVWLDDALVMDYWQLQDSPWHYLDRTYLEGTHTLKVEYFERAGNARISFWWELSDGSAPKPAPTPSPSVSTGAGTPGPWTGYYFNNTTLSGEPALTRNDNSLKFDWNWESPAPEVRRDYFSARWSGAFWFDAGRYTFSTFSDDGVRVYVDDRLVINSWRAMRGYRSGDVDLSSGSHSVRVEYLEYSGRANVRLSWQKSGQASAPAPTQSVCAGDPLQLDAWPVATACTPGGWVATIFVQGRGGDCKYTYGWEKELQGGPTANSMTFEVRSAGWNTAIVGQAYVTSAGQTISRGLFIPNPACP